jgi:hypothetical protein
MTFNDKAGREVKVGDLIVYGHALGRCAGLQYARVVEIRLVAGIPKIQVQGVSWDWNDMYDPRLLKASVLQFPDRVLVVTEEQVHPRVLALLKEV